MIGGTGSRAYARGQTISVSANTLVSADFYKFVLRTKSTATTVFPPPDGLHRAAAARRGPEP